MSVVEHRVIRAALFLLGTISVVLGIIGAFLPVLPTTPFILLAAWCFVKSSHRAHAWLYRQPLFGDALRNWEQNRAIARRTKIVAILMMLFSLVIMWLQVRILWLKILVTTLLLLVSSFIWTRNESGS